MNTVPYTTFCDKCGYECDPHCAVVCTCGQVLCTWPCIERHLEQSSYCRVERVQEAS